MHPPTNAAAGTAADHYGHFDLIMGRRAPEEVWPHITTHLAAHDAVTCSPLPAIAGAAPHHGVDGGGLRPCGCDSGDSCGCYCCSCEGAPSRCESNEGGAATPLEACPGRPARSCSLSTSSDLLQGYTPAPAAAAAASAAVAATVAAAAAAAAEAKAAAAESVAAAAKAAAAAARCVAADASAAAAAAAAAASAVAGGGRLVC